MHWTEFCAAPKRVDVDFAFAVKRILNQQHCFISSTNAMQCVWETLTCFQFNVTNEHSPTIFPHQIHLFMQSVSAQKYFVTKFIEPNFCAAAVAAAE